MVNVALYALQRVCFTSRTSFCKGFWDPLQRSWDPNGAGYLDPESRISDVCPKLWWEGNLCVVVGWLYHEDNLMSK